MSRAYVASFDFACSTLTSPILQKAIGQNNFDRSYSDEYDAAADGAGGVPVAPVVGTPVNADGSYSSSIDSMNVRPHYHLFVFWLHCFLFAVRYHCVEFSALRGVLFAADRCATAA